MLSLSNNATHSLSPIPSFLPSLPSFLPSIPSLHLSNPFLPSIYPIYPIYPISPCNPHNQPRHSIPKYLTHTELFSKSPSVVARGLYTYIHTVQYVCMYRMYVHWYSVNVIK